MTMEQQALSKLQAMLPDMDEPSFRELVQYSQTLSTPEAAENWRSMLGDSPQANDFITDYSSLWSSSIKDTTANLDRDLKHPDGPPDTLWAPAGASAPPAGGSASQIAEQPKSPPRLGSQFMAQLDNPPGYGYFTGGAPPSAAPPTQTYAPPAHAPPTRNVINALRKQHTNAVIEAGQLRARDEVTMQNYLQRVQMQYGIYNTEIEPEHESDYPCGCMIHQYKRMKWNRVPVQDAWSKAVMYPGEKAYTDCNFNQLFPNSPYTLRVVSPYPKLMSQMFGPPKPDAKWHAMSVRQTIALNAKLNQEAQRKIDDKEPKTNIWGSNTDIDATMAKVSLAESGDTKQSMSDEKQPIDFGDEGKGQTSSSGKPGNPAVLSKQRPAAVPAKSSRFAGLKKSLGMKTTEEKTAKQLKLGGSGGGDFSQQLREGILGEEAGRWPDPEWRSIVATYQDKVGMTKKIADLRRRQPIQYLHLLRAGYFEPIPVAWANLVSNPLKFSIEAAAGWRGITPAWRGYEDTAEERLYWVLNHREGTAGTRLKPDFISAMDMARERMASAVEPPPQYFSPDDTCHVQHTSEGYSVQVMPKEFHAYDRPEVPSDDTMILLDVSGSMDFDPMRPVYDQYLIKSYKNTRQPKNKDVAKAIIRRFTDAMANHDHAFSGYDLVTFANSAVHCGTINHQNLDATWKAKVKLGGGTRVMTGWQKVKELHFEKHAASAIHHPVYGWQAGPETPMLRLLLLLDGEATDMDEFELDLLGLSWAHVTIFLIGAEGCPHHHRHANELQRISDVNHHVSFVDAQGNTPERFVTHELLKRHLGYSMSMQEFKEIETPPPYTMVS